MAWTTPKTWSTGELVTATDLNLHLRDNLAVLKSPPTALTHYIPGSPLQITATSFVDIHSSLNFNLNTNGGALLIGLVGRVYHGGGSHGDCYFDINVNGISQGGSSGVYWVVGSNAHQLTGSVAWLTAPLDAGSQTIKIQCKRGGGNANPVQIYNLFAWVREVS